MTDLVNGRDGLSKLPLVCICIPTFNVAGTVRQTLKSVLDQNYSNLVVHVSDNASTDNTLKVVKSIVDSRVTIHPYAENIGGEGNFNRCIQLAEGKYTAIFHADDVYEPNMVAKQVAFLEANPEAGAVFTEASLIDDAGARIGEIRLPHVVTSQDGRYDFITMFKAILKHSNFFICPSAMVRTQVYQQEIRCWNGEQFKSSADLDLWLRILQKHPIGYLTERLMCYRISNTQGSAVVRSGTARADFFLVTDHYLSQDWVRSQLGAIDWKHYRWLERRDRIMQAVNCFLTDRSSEVFTLTNDIFSRDTISAALHTKRGLFVFLLGGYTRILTALGWKKFGKASLVFIKRMIGK